MNESVRVPCYTTRVWIMAMCLVGLSLIALPFPVRAATTIDPATIQAAPGTVTGAVTALYDADDSRVTLTEGDATAVSNAQAWLKPNSDVTVSGGGGAWKSNTCSDPLKFDCLDDDPIHDGNTTYIVCDTTSNICGEEEFDFENLPALDITIDSVTPFLWTRKNGTLDPAHTFDVHMVGFNCIVTPGSYTQEFANYSGTFLLDCSTGLAWDPTDFQDNWYIGVTAAFCVGPGGSPCTVTAAGVVVQYDDSDYQVGAYVNFTDVSGSSVSFDYECQSSLAGGDTVNLQVNRAGGYTTVSTNVCAGTDTLNQFNLVPATDIIDGAVSFRFIDTTTNEETGESFALDMAVLTIEQGGGGEPPGGDLLVLDCLAGWWSIDCTASLPPGAGAGIVRSVWFLDGRELFAQSTGPQSSHTVSIPSVSIRANHTVIVRATFSSGESLAATDSVFQDNAFLIVLVVLGILAVVMLLLVRQSRKAKRRERAKEREAKKQKDREFWGGIFK